jgi:hypothetical protein
MRRRPRRYQESEDALSAYANELTRLGALREAVAAATRSVALVDTLYRNGLTDFQNVLDTQRALFQSKTLSPLRKEAPRRSSSPFTKPLAAGGSRRPLKSPAPLSGTRATHRSHGQGRWPNMRPA